MRWEKRRPKFDLDFNSTIPEQIGITSRTIDKKLQQMDFFHRQSGRIYDTDFLDLLAMIKSVNTLTPNQALLSLNFCGNFLTDRPEHHRQSKCTEALWEMIKSRKVNLEVCHYNALLKAYVDNNHTFSPTNFLGKLAENNIDPNQMTFQHLIRKYCQVN